MMLEVGVKTMSIIPEDDAVLLLHRLRMEVTEHFDEGDAPFWAENYELSGHEFKVRLDQALTTRGFTGNNWYWLMTAGISDYQAYWKEKDGAEY